MSTISPGNTLPERFTFNNILNQTDANQATKKNEQTTCCGLGQRLLSALRAVKNVSLKIFPCLLSEKEKNERSEKNEKKAYAFIEKMLLERVKEDKVAGIFRTSIKNETLQKIQKNKVTRGLVKNMATNKKEDPVHIYANLLKEQLKSTQEKLSYQDMLHIGDLHLLERGKDIESYVQSKLKFASERDERNFYASMDVIAKIYRTLKAQPRHEATPECIARIIAPSICDSLGHTQQRDEKTITKLSNDAADLTKYILANWPEKKPDASGSPAG